MNLNGHLGTKRPAQVLGAVKAHTEAIKYWSEREEDSDTLGQVGVRVEGRPMGSKQNPSFLHFLFLFL